MPNLARRPASKHAEDYFFLSMALLMLVFVSIGFARTYYLAGVFRANLPSPLVHLHGALWFEGQTVTQDPSHLRHPSEFHISEVLK